MTKALLGLHTKAIAVLTEACLQRKGYETEQVKTPVEMSARARTGEYSLHIMDLNLGVSGATDITPGREVYDLVRDRVGRGEALFLGISGSVETVELAERERIPAILNTNLFRWIAQLPIVKA
ncbi:MAG: hypothetical protein AABX11_02835 [Nanoarchaeota archaeon]